MLVGMVDMVLTGFCYLQRSARKAQDTQLENYISL